mgnify:CR=1 FL=1
MKQGARVTVAPALAYIRKGKSGMKQCLTVLKNSGYYFLKIVIAILLVLLVVNFPTVLILRGVVYDEFTQDCILVCVDLVMEIAILVIGFCFDWKDTRESLRYYLLPCAIVFPVHFLISLINGFYPYTAGQQVSTLGMMITGLQSGNYGTIYSPGQVPTSTYVLVYLGMTLLRIGAIVLAYYISRKKKAKAI